MYLVVLLLYPQAFATPLFNLFREPIRLDTGQTDEVGDSAEVLSSQLTSLLDAGLPETTASSTNSGFSALSSAGSTIDMMRTVANAYASPAITSSSAMDPSEVGSDIASEDGATEKKEKVKLRIRVTKQFQQ